MRFSCVIAIAAAAFGCGVARADRVTGIAGIPPAKATSSRAAASAPALRSGVVSDVRAERSQIEIDGKWLIVKPGRTLVLRKGLPVGIGAVVKGQTLNYSLASATPGEQALGVVHVP
jgi:hypothetical protein